MPNEERIARLETVLKEIWEVLDGAWAATWDRYYGKRLSVEYARDISCQIEAAKKKITDVLQEKS